MFLKNNFCLCWKLSQETQLLGREILFWLMNQFGLLEQVFPQVPNKLNKFSIGLEPDLLKTLKIQIKSELFMGEVLTNLMLQSIWPFSQLMGFWSEEPHSSLNLLIWLESVMKPNEPIRNLYISIFQNTHI